MPKKLTQEEVIKRFKEVHGDKYDYSKVIYKGTSTKVEIVCPEHGSFFQKPNSHFRKVGCPKCAKIKLGKLKISKVKNSIVMEFQNVHGDKYNYSKVNYKNSNTPIEIICPEHGSFFQLYHDHKNGSGCPMCANILKSSKMKNSKEDIIRIFKSVHASYNYSKVNYKNTTTKVEIICSKHGSFWQSPMSHRAGNGCPKCSESKGERRVREFLESNNIKYSQEIKLFENYRFDFYLEDLNTVIEYDGKQHYEPVKYFGGLEGFLKTQERDKIKTEYCLKNNIRIIRIGYFEDIKEILEGFLNA